MGKTALAFVLTANEDKLFRNLFPPDHNLGLTTLDDIKKYPKVPRGLSVRAMVIEAIKMSDRVVISPQDFIRVKDERDKGTVDSLNWPSNDYRRTIPVDKDLKDRVVSISYKYFNGSLTDTIVWCIRNLNAMLYLEPNLIKREKARIKNSVSTQVLTTRVPEAVYNKLKGEAERREITVSKLMNLLAQEHVKEEPKELVIESEEFDFDLEEDEDEDPER